MIKKLIELGQNQNHCLICWAKIWWPKALKTNIEDKTPSKNQTLYKSLSPALDDECLSSLLNSTSEVLRVQFWEKLKKEDLKNIILIFLKEEVIG